ncbi:MAG TPA: hypothetical protein VGI03_10645 [Verrucomicrobiae bacterium]|jgi:hypothetical protein
MIALNSDCLLFQLNSGESIPCSAEMICIEVVTGSENMIDAEMLRHAAASVFHYFKTELARESVTVGEFAAALEKVLRTLGLTLRAAGTELPREISISDLRMIAGESVESLELFFYPRLRDELRWQLRQSPRVLRFRGLRGCVKQLAGARRWSTRCEQMQEQIVGYLRSCLTAEPEQNDCALVVE